MGLEDIKEQIIDKFNQVRDQISEDPSVNTIKEKYQTLPANVQKGMTYGGIALIVLFTLYIPYSILSSSSENIGIYNTKRGLIRDLFRYSNISKDSSPLPKSLNESSLISSVRSAISRVELLPDQIGPISKIETKKTGKALSKAPVKALAVEAQIKQINLRELVRISYNLQNIKDHIKLIGLEVLEDRAKPAYYNANFKLVSYAYPLKLEKTEKKKKKKKKSKRKKKTRKKSK